MEKVNLEVRGMHCDNCVQSVTQALKDVEGVKLAKVSLEENQAQVTYDPAKASLETLKEAVKNAGYEVA